MKNHRSVPALHQSSQREVFTDDADGADPKLLELMRLRVAQIHQCPVSIEMYMGELTAKGETKGRLRQLEAWKTSNLFDAGERAALAIIAVTDWHVLGEQSRVMPG